MNNIDYRLCPVCQFLDDDKVKIMEIKVISFNIRCANDGDGNSIEERAPRLARVTAPYDADVIGLQEYTPMWEEYIHRHFCEKYELFNQYRTDTGWLESAPILWKKTSPTVIWISMHC